jgi:hypothetical protein
MIIKTKIQMMGNSKMLQIDADNIGTKRATFIKYQIQKLDDFKNYKKHFR